MQTNYYDYNGTLCTDVNDVLLIGMCLLGSDQNDFLRILTKVCMSMRKGWLAEIHTAESEIQLMQPRALIKPHN